MTFKIATDSCCNLPEDIIDDLDLTIFPLVFMIGEEQHQSYLKGEVTDLQQFYTHMREGKVFTTSLPNLQAVSYTHLDVYKRQFQHINFKSTAMRIFTWLMVIFMAVNIVVTVLALHREGQRTENIPPATPIDVWLDETFPDDWMQKRFENMTVSKDVGAKSS